MILLVPSRRQVRPSVWARVVVVTALVVGVVVLVVRHLDQRNLGGDTTCPNFLKMSHDKQVAVVTKYGFDPKYVTAGAVVRDAIDGCRSQQPDTTIEDALGP